MTRLYFLHARNPQAALRMIDSQVEALQAHLKRLNNKLADLPESKTFNRLGISLRISQLETLVSWLKSCKTVLPI
jgi:prefoldin subunit 5